MSDKPHFEGAFDRFWLWLQTAHLDASGLLFTSYTGNPRRVTRVTGQKLSLVETTARGAASHVERRVLRNDFAKLCGDPSWRVDSLPEVRRRHNIVNFIEFKRHMFEVFAAEFMGEPST